MKLKIIISTLVVCLVAFAVYSASNNDAFKPAEDFPREALVYVQIADLPEFIKLWNDSSFNAKYSESGSYADFRNNHLGLKLASRWREFSDAAGFPIDLEAASGFAGKNAAIAIYDIGKLEFVFIAPVSDEVFAATKFVQNQSKFEEQTLDDGTTIYRVKVESDKGRQKQELIFANAKGRFVVATSEKLIVQTLNNINEQPSRSRLIDEPSFAELREQIEPHSATVWVNQKALNADYYFKRYWLMSNVADLKNIRAGMFDFSIAAKDKKIIEHRKFLLEKAVESLPVEPIQTAETLRFLPQNIPFYRLQKSGQKSLDEAVKKTIFDNRNADGKSPNKVRQTRSSNDYSGDYSSGRFDQNIDEADELETVARRETAVDFSMFFQSSNPQTILTFTRPQILPAPLFLEFNRAAIFNVNSPANFDNNAFEAVIAQRFAENTTITASGAKLKWETKTENNVTRRELVLPLIGFSVSYATRGNQLILTNNADFLREILAVANSPQAAKQAADTVKTLNAPFTGLTVINLDKTENAYTSIFNEIEKRDSANEFFTGNVASFLGSLSDYKKIEIKQNYSGNVLDETITGAW
ncbi:MAG: hypothetical protein H7Z37_02405 [Pyrinomonadaceae bacterium]|nr:hypothetical protein [Pyrinomonadaceae bacterium]